MKFAGRFTRCIDRRLVALPDAAPASYERLHRFR
ncbi:hypothetical protein BLA3211_06348 [Burkholderia aenigmatica]|uniref:Uncharacterized protein n=1 Tax=Burkholderia aenigmatica TaxID=2015348 RepID=A0A6J5JIC5_9BURK|nr:hypothetical protein BLA3211_06348 [Burkholderia aenigmatica]VWD11007.1 hypothetical protein BLA17378_05911 [Burkholderia aenigmatica]VWD17117.1 hypothetical protein BLA18628_03616 [Burkholderia aenigmatica]